MGLDMIPLDRPKPGFEDRYDEIYWLLMEEDLPKPSFFKRLLGKKHITRKKLFEEWLSIGIKSYETIKAPRVGKDKEADKWALEQYDKLDEKPKLDDFLKQNEGLYVITLAEEQDGVPVSSYCGIGDRNIFRGEYLADCIDLIGDDLVHEAWVTKLADETLAYGNKLMEAADKIAKEHNLEHIKEQRNPPEGYYEDLENKLHLLYSLSKWLIFYGKNGHGYEADY